MSDIVAEIRGHLQTMAPHQRARLTAEQLTKAADEIERLRLTDEERAALHWFAHYGLPEHRAATLRGLLERLG